MKNAMKFLTVAFVAVVTLAVTGCQKDPEDLIIGTWNATTAYATTTITGFGEEFDGTSIDTVTFAEGDYSFTFNKDNTLVLHSVDEESGAAEDTQATYTISDKKVTITIEGQSQEMTITEISKKDLVLTFSISMAQDEASMTMDTEMHFKKAK